MSEVTKIENGQTYRIVLTSEQHDLMELYRSEVGNYPKFLKMDVLCKTGFLAAELLSKQCPFHDDCAMILFSRSGSLSNDIRYQQTIQDFPSPALFVYTLPNIVTGEIAIRHHLLAETSCYLLAAEDWDTINKVVEATRLSQPSSQILYGWIEAAGGKFYADMRIRNN